VRVCRTIEEYRRVVDGVFAAFPGFAEGEESNREGFAPHFKGNSQSGEAAPSRHLS